jgi:hypothetical protein
MSSSTIHILQHKDGKWTYIDGKSDTARNSFLECKDLEPGEYLVHIKFDWKYDESDFTNTKKERFMTFGFGTYGPADTEIKETSSQEI